METLKSHPIIWITGSFTTHKANVPKALQRKFASEGFAVTFLDGDEIVHRRSTGKPGQGDRDTRVAQVLSVATGAQLQGDVVVVALSLPAPRVTALARQQNDKFFEVFVSTPAGENAQPEIVFELANCGVDYCVDEIYKYFKQEGYVKSHQAA